ncbi:MAG: hypothetical protein UH543_07065 [Bacteroidales bacterium]|nr:hypothetical protein [Bacteroidales bacterium]
MVYLINCLIFAPQLVFCFYVRGIYAMRRMIENGISENWILIKSSSF